jgi:hypothetical protein
MRGGPVSRGHMAEVHAWCKRILRKASSVQADMVEELLSYQARIVTNRVAVVRILASYD